MKKTTLLLILLALFSVSSFAQSPFRVGANVGVTFPSGTFSELYKDGIFIELTALYTLPVKDMELTFTAGYSNLIYNNEYFINEVKTAFNAAVVNFNSNWSANIVPVTLGVRYKFPTKDFTPYISGDIGLQLISFDERFNGTRISDTSSNQSLLYISGGSDSEIETGFTAAFGAGMEIPAAEKVMINIGFKYNYGSAVYSKSYEIFREINNSNYISEELKNMSYISGNIGVVIDF